MNYATSCVQLYNIYPTEFPEIAQYSFCKKYSLNRRCGGCENFIESLNEIAPAPPFKKRS